MADILVAGSMGLMGTTALLRLANTEHSVRAIHRPYKEPHIHADNIHYYVEDLTYFEHCESSVCGMDYVFMFAGILSTAPMLAKDPVTHIRHTLEMNNNMLEASYKAGVKKYIHIGSSTAYPEYEWLDEANLFEGIPSDKYFSVGWMHRYLETLCETYATRLDNPMSIHVFRPTTIYGEYESFDPKVSHMLPALVKKVVDRQNPIEVWGDGKDERDLVYADDVFDACMLALDSKESFDIFNIGYGESYVINNILSMILKIDNFQDAKIRYSSDKPRAIQKRTLCFNKIKEKLGWEPKTSLRDGLFKMIQFYRSKQNA